jgi:hypothetical protein
VNSIFGINWDAVLETTLLYKQLSSPNPNATPFPFSYAAGCHHYIMPLGATAAAFPFPCICRCHLDSTSPAPSPPPLPPDPSSLKLPKLDPEPPPLPDLFLPVTAATLLSSRFCSHHRRHTTDFKARRRLTFAGRLSDALKTMVVELRIYIDKH